MEWLRQRLANTEKGQDTWETWIGWVTDTAAPVTSTAPTPRGVRPPAPPPIRTNNPAAEAAAAAAFMAADRRGVTLDE